MIHELDDRLHASELRYRRLFETAQDGILILDFASGQIKDVNPFLQQMLGYTREEFVGKQLWEIGAIIDKAASRSAFAILQDKGYIRYENLPLRAKDGRVINVEFISNVYSVENKQVIQCNIRDITKRREVEEYLRELQQTTALSMHEMVDTLSALIEQRDPYTSGHQGRVASMSEAIAHELNLPAHNIESVRMGALVHDIGKIAIPAEVLTKPTKLTDFEMAMMRNHVQAGYDVLRHIHFPWPVALIVLQHHERLDGSGYPNGLTGDNICMEARIIAVADTVEAMTRNRPYRVSPGLEVALETIISGSDKLFDRNVVQACVRLFREKQYEIPGPAFLNEPASALGHL